MKDSFDQSYISNTLFHFVGRSAETDEERYKILSTILSSQVLLFDPHKNRPNAVPMFRMEDFRKLGEISSIPAVCFCDIPISNLSLHMSKYSKFGIGLKKQDLCRKGVRPVWYIPKDAPSTIVSSEMIETRFPAELLKILKSTSTIIDKLTEGTDIADQPNVLSKDEEIQKCLQALHSGHFFLLAEILWYFKFYDSSLPEEDINNFYYEREWRKVNSNLSFTQEKLDCVIVPSKSFRQELIYEFPQYKDIVEIR